MRSNPTYTPEIQPALTPEEWVAWANADDANELGYGRYELQHQPDVTVHEVRNYADGITCNNGYHEEEFSPNARDRHALAALCLHQQPFGFDAADVELASRIAASCDGTYSTEDDAQVFVDSLRLVMRDWHRLLSLASRIAALLPPDSAHSAAGSPQEGPP